MAIKMRRGREADFDPNKMSVGEWAVSLDTQYVRMCFAPGVCLRMATYESFERDMETVRAILVDMGNIKLATEAFMNLAQQHANTAEEWSKTSKSWSDTSKGWSDTSKTYSRESRDYANSSNSFATQSKLFSQVSEASYNAMFNLVEGGYYKGDKGDRGDKGDKGDSGAIMPASGFFTLYYDSDDGNLYVVSNGTDNIPDFEYDEATGNLYIKQEV